LKVISENARGYVCLDCNNSNLFEGMSDLYRLYKPSNPGSTNYDFDNEIVCPYEMKCHECGSRNIGIEIEAGEIIKNNKITDQHGMWLIGERWLLDVDDSNDLQDLIKIIIESEGEMKSDEAYSYLMEYGWDDWNWDEEIFSESELLFSIVQIVSSGIIRQDEYGLGDEDSSYDNARYFGIC
tara:strand:+ start:283 stop:828 length:546 start_codon:yes stop_codon:yes gene_type:complete